MAANPPTNLAQGSFTVIILGTKNEVFDRDAGICVTEYMKGQLLDDTDNIPAVAENWQLPTEFGTFGLWHMNLEYADELSKTSALYPYKKSQQILLCMDVSSDADEIAKKLTQFEELMSKYGYDTDIMKQKTTIIFSQVGSEQALTAEERLALVKEKGFDSVVEVNCAVEDSRKDIFKAIIEHQAVVEETPELRKRDKFKQKLDETKTRLSSVAASFL